MRSHTPLRAPLAFSLALLALAAPAAAFAEEDPPPLTSDTPSPDTPNQDRANQNRANQDRANQDRANQDRANQDRANQDRANPDRPAQDPRLSGDNRVLPAPSPGGVGIILRPATGQEPPTAADESGQTKKRGPRHEVGSPPPISSTGLGFSFGSYGRVNVGINGRGNSGHPVNVVSRGSRLEAPPYLELNLYYGGAVDGLPDGRWRVVLAPAFAGDLFHYNGSFSSRFAIRNAYAETENILVRGLNLWAGSRMLRGDDIYLFDYWPLDNLNTVGGGAMLNISRLTLQIHAGLNRLNDPLQYQSEPTPPRGVGPPGQALILDRPRTVVSFKGTYRFGPEHRPWGAKLVGYGEVHYMSEGERLFVQQLMRRERLPAEVGFVVGAQFGAWLRPFTFVNMFVRYAGGLGVYGDISLPRSVNAQLESSGAREFVAALSLNYESRWLGVMGGAYFRYYGDPATQVSFNPQTYVEGTAGVRPTVYLTNHLHVAAELSFQQRQYGGIDPWANRRLEPTVLRASLMPIISPAGRGTYSRPNLYGVVTVSLLDDDARLALFDPADVRYRNATVWYLGLGAEWWFQSSYR